MSQSKVLIVLIILALIIGFIWYGFPVNKTVQHGAQQHPKRIAAITASDLQLVDVDGVKAGMAELGLKEGKDYVLDIKNPKGDAALAKRFASDIVASNPDLIISVSTSASSAVRDADKDAKIPLVAVDIGNFKQAGIADIQHPGGYYTAVVVDNVSVAPKRMEILKILKPSLKKVAALIDPTHISYQDILNSYEGGTAKLGLKINWYKVSKKEEVSAAMKKIVSDGNQAFMTTPQPIVTNSPDIISAALNAAKIISIDNNIEIGISGGYLMSYGVTRFDTGKQAARIINKVLNGESPGNIPVEFASQITFEINSQLAKKMGIQIPEPLLSQANKIY